MQRKMFYSVLILLVISIIGGTYLFREFNRRNLPVSAQTPLYRVSSNVLIAAFSEHGEAANKKYLGNIIEVTGNLKAINKDDKGNYTIVLGDTAQTASIRCSMSSDKQPEYSKKMIGNPVTIIGVCTGYLPDELGLGADIILNRSEFKQ
ncbi:MAG: hypothetical protein RLZZ28_2432 [Bacteroidota bacterium]|jgi:hypothetical protein